MQQLDVVTGNHSYTITIAAGLFHHFLPLTQLQRHQTCLVVTDNTVAPLYLDSITMPLTAAGVKVDRLILPEGESHKAWPAVAQIFDRLLERQHGRDTTLLALGGGVIGDITGFAAACYQRGVRYLQLPTTLLAQVDASVGGKTAINHPLGKNMIGAFHHPAAVLIDIDTLNSLPPRQLSSGLAEIIKSGMILDASLFEWLEQHIEALLHRDPPALLKVIRRCCTLKAALVAQDERDHGQRRLLNFGHTFAHAIEAYTGYDNWHHGEAVAAGMVLEARLAESLGLIRSNVVERLKKVLGRACLPITGPAEMSPEAYWPYLQRDKKVVAKKLQWALPTCIGDGTLVENIDQSLLAAMLETCSG
jgi:3-dehydroquinate synthase